MNVDVTGQLKEKAAVCGSFKFTMHRFLLPKWPCLEERLRNKIDVEEEEMPGVSGVDF